jgi:hypothetical protein
MTRVNVIKSFKIYGNSWIGFGLKKTECQDSYSVIEKLADGITFAAVYDGHGSSGKEAS